MQRPPKDSDTNAAVAERLRVERRRQLTVLLILAAAILLGSVLLIGVRNVFLPHWWRIDLP